MKGKYKTRFQAVNRAGYTINWPVRFEHIQVGTQVRKTQMVDEPVQFKRGFFSTDDKELIKRLKAHHDFGKEFVIVEEKERIQKAVAAAKASEPTRDEVNEQVEELKQQILDMQAEFEGRMADMADALKGEPEEAAAPVAEEAPVEESKASTDNKKPAPKKTAKKKLADTIDE